MLTTAFSPPILRIRMMRTLHNTAMSLTRLLCPAPPPSRLSHAQGPVASSLRVSIRHHPKRVRCTGSHPQKRFPRAVHHRARAHPFARNTRFRIQRVGCYDTPPALPHSVRCIRLPHLIAESCFNPAIRYTDYRPTPLQHYMFPAGSSGTHRTRREAASVCGVFNAARRHASYCGRQRRVS